MLDTLRIDIDHAGARSRHEPSILDASLFKGRPMHLWTLALATALTTLTSGVASAVEVYYDSNAFFAKAGPSAGELIFDGRTTQPPGGPGDYSSSSYTYGECDRVGCYVSGTLPSLTAPITYIPPGCCNQVHWIEIGLPVHQVIVPPYGDIYDSFDQTFAIQVSGNTDNAYLSIGNNLTSTYFNIELNGYNGFIGVIADPNSLGFDSASMGTSADPDTPAANATNFSINAFYLPSPVPEPSSWTLMAAGVLCVALARRRKDC